MLSSPINTDKHIQSYQVTDAVGSTKNNSPDFVVPVDQLKGSISNFFKKENDSSLSTTTIKPTVTEPIKVKRKRMDDDDHKKPPVKFPKKEIASSNNEKDKKKKQKITSFFNKQ